MENLRPTKLASSRRRGNLHKKAAELSELCGAQVAVFSISKKGSVSVYPDSADSIIDLYLESKKSSHSAESSTMEGIEEEEKEDGIEEEEEEEEDSIEEEEEEEDMADIEETEDAESKESTCTKGANKVDVENETESAAPEEGDNHSSLDLGLRLGPSTTTWPIGRVPELLIPEIQDQTP